MIKRILSPATLVIAVLVASAGLLLYRETFDAPATPFGGFVVPPLSEEARAGEVIFNANCAKCHGTNGTGTDKGPPLVHDIYNPGHHSDEAFQSAVRNGAPQHHWPFGNMPAQPQVTPDQVTQILSYIRALQTANGIHYRPHRM